MRRPVTIRRSLVISFAAVIALILGLLLAITVIGARSAAEEQSARLLERALQEANAELAGFFRPVGGLLEVGQQSPDPDAYVRSLEPIMKRVPQILAMRVAPLGDHDPADFGATPVRWSRPRALDDGEPGMTAAVLVGRRVIEADVRLDDISTFTRSLDVTPNARVLALVPRPLALATPERTMAVIGLPHDARYESPASRHKAFLKPARDLGLPFVNDAVAALMARGENRLEDPLRFESEGDAWWSAIARYDLDPELPVMTVVLIPEDDFLGDRTTQRLYLLGAAALAFGLALAVAAWLSRRAGRPIEALVAQTERIRRGDFSPGSPIVTRLVEVRELTEAHEDMRRGLAHLMRLERDLQVARQIQQATFPSGMPEVPGYEVFGSSVPADDTGGDTYDVIAQGDRVALLLADATGHGIGPALSVAGLIAMLRMASRLDAGVAAFMRHANEQLREDLPGGRFITTWLGVLDPTTHAMQTFSAGQGPILHYRAQRDAFESPKADSVPLGIMTFDVELPAPTTLEPRDVYAVLSDGFHEAVNAEKELFGEERVRALIREYAAETPEAITAALHTAVNAFTDNAPADDDRTCVIVKRQA